MQYKRAGDAIVFNHNINIDILHPAKYFSLDSEIVKEGLFAGIELGIAKEIADNRIIVAGRNFGCGSSREVTTQSFLLNNINLLVAESFARIFLRNCVNHRMILIEVPGVLSCVKDRNNLNIDLEKKVIVNNTQNIEISIKNIFSKFR